MTQEIAVTLEDRLVAIATDPERPWCFEIDSPIVAQALSDLRACRERAERAAFLGPPEQLYMRARDAEADRDEAVRHLEAVLADVGFRTANNPADPDDGTVTYHSSTRTWKAARAFLDGLRKGEGK